METFYQICGTQEFCLWFSPGVQGILAVVTLLALLVPAGVYLASPEREFDEDEEDIWPYIEEELRGILSSGYFPLPSVEEEEEEKELVRQR
ncbi:MAG: hypothetical protein PHH49_05795 [Candidatus Omnitrophica bacterium]|nr:hypothetical protein [Candidatus Omnitrophota bacterium]MDD5488456.1 hypothetical protein [Candidatus Omnitrophota bacterium]